MGEEATDTERVVQDAFDRLNGDSSKVEAIAESVDVYGPALPDGEVHSRDEWASFIRANGEGFPDIEFSMQELVAGDTAAMAELTLSGAHQGELMGVPPTGREVEIRAVDESVVEVDGGHSVFDATAAAGRSLRRVRRTVRCRTRRGVSCHAETPV